jgi:putative endonuclease
MASVYILYSSKIDRYYIGSCLDLSKRIYQHNSKLFRLAFTQKTDDWILFLSIDELLYHQARSMEIHIKKMKSRKYIQQLKEFPELIVQLKNKFSL